MIYEGITMQEEVVVNREACEVFADCRVIDEDTCLMMLQAITAAIGV